MWIYLYLFQSHRHSRSIPPTESSNTACTPYNTNSFPPTAGTDTDPAHTHNIYITNGTHTGKKRWRGRSLADINMISWHMCYREPWVSKETSRSFSCKSSNETTQRDKEHLNMRNSTRLRRNCSTLEKRPSREGKKTDPNLGHI